MPVRIASAAWRRRWTASREASLVIQVVLPERAAIWPSRVSAVFSVTKGRPVRIHLAKSSLSSRAAASLNASVTSIPARRSCCEASACDGGIRIEHRGDDALDSCGDDRVRAGAGAAGGAAGFEGDVERCAARFFAGFFQRDDFGVVAAIVGVEAFADDAVIFDDDAPTIGLGCARAVPRAARARARVMCDSSTSTLAWASCSGAKAPRVVLL